MIRWVFRPFTQLWASICTSERPSDLHLFFNRLRPRHVKIIIFRVVSELISLRSFKKIQTGRMCQGSSPLPSYSLSLRIRGFFTIILSTLMHSLIRVSRRDIWRVSSKYKSRATFDSVAAIVSKLESKHNCLSLNSTWKDTTRASFENRPSKKNLVERLQFQPWSPLP